MVMKRYPHGAAGEFFFMKRAPTPRPDWIEICSIEHESGNVIDFPMIQDLPSLLWVINLGCIDLNQWYARCDDVDRPDYLHFDLDPGAGAGRSSGCARPRSSCTRRSRRLSMPALVKTTGSRGIHVYVPIVRGPTQKEVWTFAKALRARPGRARPGADHRRVPRSRSGRRAACSSTTTRTRGAARSRRSTRCGRSPGRAVSTPVTWEEVERGVRIEDFRLENVPARVAKLGDLWKPLLARPGRFRLERVL